MANTITDARTLLFDGGDGTGGAPVDLAGASTGTADTSTYLEGASSYTISASNSLVGMMYDAGTAQNWSSNHFYITANSGVVGLMSTKAAGGFRVRFCGATVTDFFEVYVGGNDSWPIGISGGWVNFVVDIEEAWTNPDNTGGTKPATSAIRYVGIANLLGSMPKMADNTWLDTIHRLPDGTAGVLIQGRNGGTTDWDSADILTQLGTGQMVFWQGPGGSYVVNAPVQIGISDTTTHGFTDTNATWLWDDQEFVATDLYKISALGNSGGTTNVTFGSKSGTGTGATGAQGLAITANSSGVRWDLDFDDPDLDAIGFYGCSFQHGGSFQLDDVAVEAINTLFVDVTTVEATNSDLFLKNSYINSSTTADNGALVWNENLDVDGILDSSTFEQGTAAHHAIDFGTAVATELTLRGFNFTGFSSVADSNGATLRFLATSGSINVNLVDCTVDGGLATTANVGVDDAAGIVVTLVVDPKTTKLTITEADGTFIENARVFLETADNGGGSGFPYEAAVSTLTQAAGVATLTASAAHGLDTGDKVVVRGAAEQPYNSVVSITVTSTTVFTYVIDSGATTPAGGTPIFSYVPIQGLTNASGVIQSSKTWPASQSLKGYARKSSASPYFKQTAISIADASGGTDLQVALQPDE